jgi:protein-arginine kinase activator protein McsA
MGPKAAIRQELMELKDALAQAVANEQYEKAAKIRDRIQELESKVED